jgi:phage terminase large subunit-like protein
MSDDDFVDMASTIKHAKKMHSDREYRQKYRRLDFYTPHPKQLEFHNSMAAEVLLRAGNQLGKTTAVAAQMTMDSLGLYPSWYKGIKHVRPNIERPHEFVGWCASVNSVMTRDGAQLKLLGDVSQAGGMGTGLLPLGNIVGFTNSRGISGFCDAITVRRESGGLATISFKTYEMQRQAFQSSSCDRVWLDEDVSRTDDDIVGECVARLAATNGRLYVSMTPLLGKSPLRRRFDEPGHPERVQVRMRLVDALHIDASQHEAIAKRYKASERATRLDGEDLQGSGAVFEIPEEMIKHNRDPATFPHYWRWLAAVDFSHGGMSASAHPFTWVLAAYDPDNDIIFLTHTIKMAQALPIQHVHAPMDGSQRDFSGGETFAGVYKRLGLNMLGKHATFPDGSVSMEAGISEMESRFATGRLKVANHLGDWFEEFRQYHREDLKIVPVDDDLLSATRQLVMQIRSAKVMDADRGQGSGYQGIVPGEFRRKGQATMARGLTFADDEL